jgi:phosphonate transport system substrate-binding protein
MNVYLGISAAGATWAGPWKAFVQRNPDIAESLVVKWETPPLLNNSLIARDDVPQETIDKVAALLFALHTTGEGRKLLSVIPLEKFESATDRNYQPVCEFMEKYNSLIH